MVTTEEKRQKSLETSRPSAREDTWMKGSANADERG